MAKYNINETKTQKLLAKASNVLPFNRQPIVIPRDKLEAAHLKVMKAKKREKYLIIAILTLTAALVAALIR